MFFFPLSQTRLLLDLYITDYDCMCWQDCGKLTKQNYKNKNFMIKNVWFQGKKGGRGFNGFPVCKFLNLNLGVYPNLYENVHINYECLQISSYGWCDLYIYYHAIDRKHVLLTATPFVLLIACYFFLIWLIYKHLNIYLIPCIIKYFI